MEIAKNTKFAGNTSVTVFCDSQTALKAIALPPAAQQNRFLRGLIRQKTEDLERTGHRTRFEWVPSHSGLIGNEKADLIARNRAERRGRLIERWSSLSYIRKNITEKQIRDITSWYETETQNREANRSGHYIPRTKVGICSALGKTPKKYTSRYYQLKVGHSAIGTFLARVGAIETPKCWWCGAREQTVEHLYTRCRKWRKQRSKLVRELEKEGIRWQPQVERRWLADLLGDEKAVVPLIKYLKNTGIGGREGAREKELEWEQRNDQAGENLIN